MPTPGAARSPAAGSPDLFVPNPGTPTSPDLRHPRRRLSYREKDIRSIPSPRWSWNRRCQTGPVWRTALRSPCWRADRPVGQEVEWTIRAGERREVGGESGRTCFRRPPALAHSGSPGSPMASYPRFLIALPFECRAPGARQVLPGADRACNPDPTGGFGDGSPAGGPAALGTPSLPAIRSAARSTILPLIVRKFARIHAQGGRAGAKPLDRTRDRGRARGSPGVLVLLVLSALPEEPGMGPGGDRRRVRSPARLPVAARRGPSVRCSASACRISSLRSSSCCRVAYLAILPGRPSTAGLDGDRPWWPAHHPRPGLRFDADLTSNYAREDWKRFMERPSTAAGDPVGPGGSLARHNRRCPLALRPTGWAARRGALAMMAVFTAASFGACCA